MFHRYYLEQENRHADMRNGYDCSIPANFDDKAFQKA